MSVYKRGKIWWVSIPLSGGETLRKSSGSSKQKIAKTLERRLKAEVMENKTRGILGLKPAYTFEQAVIKFIESGNAPKSMASHIKQTALVLRHVPLNEDIIAATSDMKQELLKQDKSPCTVNRRLAVVQRILNVAYAQWRWTDMKLGDFISPMKMSEKDTARHVYLTPERATAYLIRINNLEIRRGTLVLCISGLRVSELLKLEPVNWTGNALRLDANQKGKTPRSIPIAPEYRFLFEDLPLKFTRSGLRYWWTIAREGDDVWLHDLRHTFGSWLALDPSIPMAVIRDVMGHGNLNTTNRYLHIRSENQQHIGTAMPTNLLPGETTSDY